MKKIIIPLAAMLIALISVVTALKTKDTSPSAVAVLKERLAKKPAPSVDHSKFEVLKTKFPKPQNVTEACISCHTERGKEVMKSNHWMWEREEYVAGRGIVRLGKKNAINNFCIGTEGNEKSCAKCHTGFGMTDPDFSYNDPKFVDCLVCHDNTETYAKAQEQGGRPDSAVDLNNVARHVGKPKRTNCGVCHFFGGGGNNVKHGDLEKSMFEASKDVDVHMGTDGSNLQCVECHKAENHKMLGKIYSLSSMNRDRSTCEQCHGGAPHKDDIVNEHALKVACQTCHIPVYAKVNATKMEWDWSTAGKLKDGKPYEIDDKDGNHLYLSIKGSFRWAKNVKPEYIWFNGTASHYLPGDKIGDTSLPLKINELKGSYADEGSKIIPVKIHRAVQPYDPVNKMLIEPKLFADRQGEGAFWKDFDWQKASAEGMKAAGLPFSGRVGFIKTEMTWPVNHMVSSKEKTVACAECHQSENSRLAGLGGFYMPARDRNPAVEFAGNAMIILTLCGIFIHGSMRYFAGRKRKTNHRS